MGDYVEDELKKSSSGGPVTRVGKRITGSIFDQPDGVSEQEIFNYKTGELLITPCKRLGHNYEFVEIDAGYYFCLRCGAWVDVLAAVMKLEAKYCSEKEEQDE